MFLTLNRFLRKALWSNGSPGCDLLQTMLHREKRTFGIDYNCR